MNPQKKEGIVIDSSLSLSTKDLSPAEFKQKLIYLLEPILAARFPGEPQKQRIKIHTNRLSIACPYCGDSMKKSNAKRGNIILDGKFINTYKCFNCDEFHSVEKFIKDFQGNLDLDTIDHIAKTKVDFETYINKKYDVGFLLDREAIEKYAISRDDIKEKLGLDEVENYPIWNWLKHRLQFQKERYLYNHKKNYLAILHLVDNDKVIGLQRRTFTGENKYLTYKLSKLYEIFQIDTEIPDEVDSISTLFGIMELNFARPITLFEGPFDSFLFKNSVAMSGGSKSFPIEMPLRYWFDDDKFGRKKAMQHIEQNEAVFLWDKFKRENEIPHRKKWDLNDIMMYFKNNNIRVPHFEEYFSDDPLDIIEI